MVLGGVKVITYSSFVLFYCQEILTLDPRNYNALVFRGAALVGLQRIMEALDSYRQATQADPAQILAWQVGMGVSKGSFRVQMPQNENP